MNLDYSRVTHEQLLEQFKNRIISDPRFKDMSAAAIFQMYMEMMAGTFDMLHFYLGRTAEEMFLDSAKLDSSVIKLSKNLGYNPKRAIPATANIAVRLQGPLPKNAAENDVIWFNNELLQLKFNNKPYRLDHCYSYTLNADDIANGVNNPNWSKIIQFSIPSGITDGWIPLSTNRNNLEVIKIVQCEIKTKEIYAVANAEHLTESYQFYDIDDIKFSNYYGQRDPYAYYEGEYTPLNGWCKVGIGLNKTDAFSEEKLCDIEIENIYCNSKVKAANDDENITKKLNVCRIESNQDKTVRISFGDGSIVNNGFNSEDEILYVQYVVTDGYAANTPDVVGSVLTNSSRIMAHAPGKVYDITDNVSFILTTNISNGDDFESAQRMKNSAAIYFASRGQLINKKDFNSYFNSMSRPIHAKNAVAWTTKELETSTNVLEDDTMYTKFKQSIENTRNALFYTVIGDLYESLGNNKYKVKMLYATDDALQVNNSTLYNNSEEFIQHISDLSRCCSNADEVDQVATDQRGTNAPFYLKTSEIYNDIEEKLQFGVVPICVPPIVQYFDLVGDVQIDRTTNVATYQADIESKIYKWLVDRQKFNNKIYKSDIIKLIYDNAATKSVSVDIMPSSLVHDTNDYYRFDNLTFTPNDNANYPYIDSVNDFKNNRIVIPPQSNGRIINSNIVKNTKTAMSVAKFMTASSIGIGVNTSESNHPDMKQVSVTASELSDGRIQLMLNDADYTFSEGDKLWISFGTEEEAYYSPVKIDDSIAAEMQGTANLPANESTINTPVPLPYIANVKHNDSDAETLIGRILTYKRKNNKYDINTITEKMFNIALAPTYYDYYNDLYQKIKYVIEDNILDDNNNIVNYTLPNEISVVRIKLNYTYGR